MKCRRVCTAHHQKQCFLNVQFQRSFQYKFQLCSENWSNAENFYMKLWKIEHFEVSFLFHTKDKLYGKHWNDFNEAHVLKRVQWLVNSENCSFIVGLDWASNGRVPYR